MYGGNNEHGTWVNDANGTLTLAIVTINFSMARFIEL